MRKIISPFDLPYKNKLILLGAIVLFWALAFTLMSFVTIRAAETTAITDGDGNLVVTVTITPNEKKFMEYDLLSIQDWVHRAVVGKVSKCKDRMVREWDANLKADKNVTSIPTDETQWLNMVTSREDYKARTARGESVTPAEKDK